MTHKKIGIVIPAYKSTYLAETMSSLANQTDKDFAVYIGDDCSPSDLYSIILPFTEFLNITYVRFEQNLGGKDLVAQWYRCLDLLKDEDYFIMFSDDDIMEPQCIEYFKKELQNSDEDVYHFDIQIIDRNGLSLGTPTHYDPLLSADQFFKELIIDDLQARMPEFAFKTSHFKKCGGFVKFKNALRTDHATVFQCAFEKGIRTVRGPLVLWRDSGINISSSIAAATPATQDDFFSTTVHFFNWAHYFCDRNGTKPLLSTMESFDYLYSCGHNVEVNVGSKKRWEIFKQYIYYPKGITGLIFWGKFLIFKIRRKIRSFC